MPRTTADKCNEVSHLSIWLIGIPLGVGAASEVFVNVTAYGIAYSRAPAHMRGFVMALSLFMTSINTAIGLVAADAVKDPYLGTNPSPSSHFPLILQS
jgi:dipeptide/tripeptide permease